MPSNHTKAGFCFILCLVSFSLTYSRYHAATSDRDFRNQIEQNLGQLRMANQNAPGQNNPQEAMGEKQIKADSSDVPAVPAPFWTLVGLVLGIYWGIGAIAWFATADRRSGKDSPSGSWPVARNDARLRKIGWFLDVSAFVFLGTGMLLSYGGLMYGLSGGNELIARSAFFSGPWVIALAVCLDLLALAVSIGCWLKYRGTFPWFVIYSSALGFPALFLLVVSSSQG
jgi:hypothetical protein